MGHSDLFCHLVGVEKPVEGSLVLNRNTDQLLSLTVEQGFGGLQNQILNQIEALSFQGLEDVIHEQVIIYIIARLIFNRSHKIGNR